MSIRWIDADIACDLCGRCFTLNLSPETEFNKAGSALRDYVAHRAGEGPNSDYRDGKFICRKCADEEDLEADHDPQGEAA